tara:strand:+ start:1074 stop:1778 length:705 start_codon:yes stop_codon:yes gene_type:complete
LFEAMKYQTAKFADGMFNITCPHCSNEVAVDETQLGQINAQMGGRYPCPIGNCGQEIHFPNAEEAEALKTGGAAPAAGEPTQPAPAPAPTAAAPAPPPQSNPAAKPTQPPTEPPAKPQEVPAAEPKPEAAPSTAESSSEAKPAPADEIVIGFGGGTTATLEREAASLHKLSVKTILRSECAKAKKDFDEEVSKFLSSIDEENLVEVHSVQYTEDDKKGTDFGLMILYKIVPEED